MSTMKTRAPNSKDENISTFEWLTNFQSLSHLLNPDFLFPMNDGEGEGRHANQQDNFRVLHVGCGSSTLGEMLTRRFKKYNLIINTDNDDKVLSSMKQRWEKLTNQWELNGERIISKCIWSYLDFKQLDILSSADQIDDHEVFKIEPKYFDLVMDKSTLDCALCSDDATSGLLYNVYHSLAQSGVYFVVSFHHVDLVMPILKNCPGIDWDVQHFTVPRQVDNPMLIDTLNATYRIKNVSNTPEDFNIDKGGGLASAWSNLDGTFQPNEEYRKVVNVYICRKRQHNHESDDTGNVHHLNNRNDLRIHIHDCNDLYFKKHNPMLTHVRKEVIKNKFEEKKIALKQSSIHQDENSIGDVLSLRTCYEILFTDAKKEYHSYEYFLEDYEAFSKDHCGQYPLLTVEMSCESAVLFLETMQ